MGAAEFISKGQSQHVSTEQDFWTSSPGRMGRTDPQVSLHGYQLHWGRETGEWPSTWGCRPWLSILSLISTPL